MTKATPDETAQALHDLLKARRIKNVNDRGVAYNLYAFYVIHGRWTPKQLDLANLIVFRSRIARTFTVVRSAS